MTTITIKKTMNKDIIPAFSLSTLLLMIVLWTAVYVLFTVLDIDNDIHRISKQLEIDLAD